ncbi:heterokaryon incompatibility protein [Colletotrichum plurivorum]|uniref:Heterokaryon incompatibility protein n=1 Tax=Colletotrichum plurivorum TaxID=2175906 RepID=A0A8H6K225_9PEZI|nr:heterokaryon incompatibility protein [Colletotrichum plurivorum]
MASLPHLTARCGSAVTNTEDDWYAKYIATRDISKDELRHSFSEQLGYLEAEVHDLALRVEVSDGFCSACRYMFDNWPSTHPEVPDNDISQDAPTLGSNCSTQPEKKLLRGAKGERGVVLPWLADTASLECATKQGCRSCAFILQCIVEERLLVSYKAIERRLKGIGKPLGLTLVSMKWWEGGSQFLQLSFPGKGFDTLQQTGDYYIEICSGPGKSLKTRYEEFPMSNDTSLSLIAHWTSTCLGTHEDCNQNRALAFPTRLLSLATEPIRLVTTTSWDGRPRYATLSHRWGGRKALCLTHANMSGLESGISADTLSQTFKDAIMIARRAGLRYLWIDSLCIVQGDLGDWSTQSGRMSSVYGGSSLNISASSADRESEGCFLRPEYFSSGFSADITIDGRKERHDFARSSLYANSVTLSKLASRGWVVQEKILSPRTVHCGKEGLFWECKSTMASEFFPGGFHQGPFLGGVEYPLVRRRSSLEIGRRGTLRGNWERTRSWYSACDLTVPGDKLVAIAGVARATHEETGNHYYAGLWRAEMENDLCWFSEDPRERPAYRAPSWSWAAVDGRVGQYHKHGILDKIYASVVSVDVAEESDPFGAVSGGSISLRCAGMLSACVRRRHEKPSPDDIGENRELAVVLGTDHVFGFSPDCLEEPNGADHPATVFFLPVQGGDHFPTARDGKRRSSACKSVTGLVICETGLERGQYRRIGAFNIDPLWDDRATRDSFMRLMDEFGAQVLKERCVRVLEGEDDPDTYLIHVV